jgi:Na+-transporting NADH:ubiquinone oxidoreductase subunit NqrF
MIKLVDMAIRFRFKDKIVTVPCLSQLNLLAHAQIEELEIGSQCGGHGICGGDRLKTDPLDRSKFSPITEIERKHFSNQQLQAGYRLGCQCWPEADDLEMEVQVG